MGSIVPGITAVGAYLPDYILTNQELEKMVDTDDEWITTRTGIKERRILKGEKQGTSVMAVKALEQLLEKSGTDPKDLDAVILATITPDYFFPTTANLVATEVGAVNAFGFDMLAACSGF
ncbi:MAG: 3-oxoacyl-ACP synthase, partial [Cyclobacteriaceae bacterium]|nr:3-oxoacyl-ACP synthase [Cyclobacteriaceae bacterium]MCK5370600.1 3-oxoacyl-ACP synthase [Cyclobacteriaceae bacterium]